MKAGHTAHLDLDTHAGQAWIGLKVMIRPFQPQQNQHHSSRKSRNPAYYRRQERRKALRKAAKASTEPSDTNAEEAAKASTKPSDTNAEEAIVPDKKAEDPNKKTEDSEVTISENLASEATDKNVETFSVKSDKKDEASNTDITICAVEKKVSFCNKEISFFCELCDFRCNSEKGLNIHLTRKHPKIDQLDGNISLIETEESNLTTTDIQVVPSEYNSDSNSLLETLSESLTPAPYRLAPAQDFSQDELNQFLEHCNEIYLCKQFLQFIIVKVRDNLMFVEKEIENEVSEFRKLTKPDLPKTKSKKKKTRRPRKYSPCDDEGSDDQLISRDKYLLVCRELLHERIGLKISHTLLSMDKELENKLSDLEWVGTELDNRLSDFWRCHDEDQRENPVTSDNDEDDPEYPEPDDECW